MVQVPLYKRGPPQILAITPYEATILPNSQEIIQVQFPYCRTNNVQILELLENANSM